MRKERLGLWTILGLYLARLFQYVWNGRQPVQPLPNIDELVEFIEGSKIVEKKNKTFHAKPHRLKVMQSIVKSVVEVQSVPKITLNNTESVTTALASKTKTHHTPKNKGKMPVVSHHRRVPETFTIEDSFPEWGRSVVKKQIVKKRNTTIYFLNVDVLKIVLDYLDIQSRLSVKMLSKNFCSLVNSHCDFKRVNFKNYLQEVKIRNSTEFYAQQLLMDILQSSYSSGVSQQQAIHLIHEQLLWQKKKSERAINPEINRAYRMIATELEYKAWEEFFQQVQDEARADQYELLYYIHKGRDIRAVKAELSLAKDKDHKKFIFQSEHPETFFSTPEFLERMYLDKRFIVSLFILPKDDSLKYRFQGERHFQTMFRQHKPSTQKAVGHDPDVFRLPIESLLLVWQMGGEVWLNPHHAKFTEQVFMGDQRRDFKSVVVEHYGELNEKVAAATLKV